MTSEARSKLFSFSEALERLKHGKCVAREGWNGRGMYLYLVEGSTFQVNRAPLNKHLPEGTIVSYRSHIDMKCVGGEFVPWTAATSDLIEEDWVEVHVKP